MTSCLWPRPRPRPPLPSTPFQPHAYSLPSVSAYVASSVHPICIMHNMMQKSHMDSSYANHSWEVFFVFILITSIKTFVSHACWSRTDNYGQKYRSTICLKLIYNLGSFVLCVVNNIYLSTTNSEHISFQIKACFGVQFSLFASTLKSFLSDLHIYTHSGYPILERCMKFGACTNWEYLST